MSAKKPDTCKSLRLEIDAILLRLARIEDNVHIEDDEDEDEDDEVEDSRDNDPLSPEDQDALEAVGDWQRVSPIERDRVIDMLRASDNPVEKALGSRMCDELRHLLEALQ